MKKEDILIKSKFENLNGDELEKNINLDYFIMRLCLLLTYIAF